MGHEITHFIDGAIRGFDDDFVVDVHHDPTLRLGDLAHGVDKKVTGDSLDDILHQLPTVGFQASPLSPRSYSLT